jgi:hypothetical protein
MGNRQSEHAEGSGGCEGGRTNSKSLGRRRRFDKKQSEPQRLFEVWVASDPGSLFEQSKPITGFSYPESTTKVDKVFDRIPGRLVASCCKATFDGQEPHRWPVRASAEFVASAIDGVVREVRQ